ncbi:MAG: hypothetical protein QGG36_05415 [Pirellulaceae bacterium]|jgi:hypothetical protein|nr:hypothetical protein [Pirellulaceae bacterium]MDP7015213.1 hypothetical protein [Pirellulaceae bacterium]
MERTSEISLLVRDREEWRQVDKLDDFTNLVAIASLSANPTTFDELRRAYARYRPEEPFSDLPWRNGPPREPSGPWCVVDLASRLVLAGNGYELPGDVHCYRERDDDSSSQIWINMPPEWDLKDTDWCTALAADPPGEIAPFDVRAILYGRPYAAHVAKRVVEASRANALPDTYISFDQFKRPEPFSDAERDTIERWRKQGVAIHAEWLLTACDELGGETPRSHLHRGREWVDREIHYRCQQWSMKKKPPLAIDRDTFAYRYGPMGTQEVVVYFAYCRELIDCAFTAIADDRNIEASELATALEALGETWLHEGSLDGEPLRPHSVIDDERRLFPLVVGAEMSDCDCPICRMEADSSEPTFYLFDGHHLELDDEFAFSLIETRGEWEMLQGDYVQYAEESREIQQSFEPETASPELQDIWMSSKVSDSVASSTMGLAFRLAEIIGNLQQDGSMPDRIGAINDAFDAYRRSPDRKRRRRAKQRLCHELEQVAAALPELTSKVADFQSQLDVSQRASSEG